MILAHNMLLAITTVDEWTTKFAGIYGPVAQSHPKCCYAKHYFLEEGLPLSEVQKMMSITDPYEIIDLVKNHCGMYQNHIRYAEYLYETLPRK